MDLYRKANHGKSVGRELLKIAQLFHLPVRQLAPGFVPLPKNFAITHFLKTLGRGFESWVPGVGVRPDDLDPHLKQVQRRIPPKST